MQRLFQTPARSLVEDEIRLLLETIHRSSFEPGKNGAVIGPSTDAPPHEQENEQESNELGSPSESFYSIKALTLTRQKEAADTGDQLPTNQSQRGLLAAYDSRLGPYNPLDGFLNRRDCHSAPIPMRSNEDRRIVEYLTARPASSGSLRPHTSDGRTILRPGTAHLLRPETSSLNTLQRPQTAVGRSLLDGVGPLRLHSPGWGIPLAVTPGRHSRVSDAREGSLSSTPGGFAPRSSSDWSRPGSSGRGGVGSSRPSTGSSVGGSAPRQVVAGVADRLNVFQVETIAAPLRQAIADERAALLEDIEYLHQLIDEEADANHKALRPPPSIKDLKDYSARLEASLRAHIAEARLKQELESAALSKENVRKRRPNLNGVANPTRHAQLDNASPAGEKAHRKAQSSKKGWGRDGKRDGVECPIGSDEVGELQVESGRKESGGDGKSLLIKNVNDNCLRAKTPVSVFGDEDALDELGDTSTRRRCLSKVQRLRSLVINSQTEASGAASLSRAEIT